MKTTILTITEIDDHNGVSDPASTELAKVHIPPVAEPLALLVSLLQKVATASKPKKPRKTRCDAGKSRNEASKN